jgi:hypothetical protein
MPIAIGVADAISRRVPRVISPQAHACADFLIAGSFLVVAALCRKSPRVSLAAALCGGAGLGLAALTDYSGRSGKLISWQTHEKLDLGLAAMAGSMPKVLSFRENRERSLFAAGAVAITVLNRATDFPRRRAGE